VLRRVEKAVSRAVEDVNNKKKKKRARMQTFFFDKNKVSKNKSESAPPRKTFPIFVAQTGPRVGVSIMYGMYNSKRKEIQGRLFMQSRSPSTAIRQSSADNPCSVSFLFF
jgi:hypothetical protein